MRDFMLFLFDVHHVLFLGIGLVSGYAFGRRRAVRALKGALCPAIR
jgi:hypothetical protein